MNYWVSLNVKLTQFHRRERMTRCCWSRATCSDYYQVCLSAVLELDSNKLERCFDKAAIDLTRTELLRVFLIGIFLGRDALTASRFFFKKNSLFPNNYQFVSKFWIRPCGAEVFPVNMQPKCSPETRMKP